MTNQTPSVFVPEAPAFEALPAAKRRPGRGAPECREIDVRLEVVTPILGGSHQTRALDDIDIVRVPSVRGHLRFWWRALYASQCSSSAELYARECALWGRAATDEGGRSTVGIRIDVERCGAIDDSDIDLQRTPGAYALWPARAEKRNGQVVTPPVQRRKPGTRFQLTARMPPTAVTEVRNALVAWIVFGGYGGRTRRGLGSLMVIDGADAWLPSTSTRDAFAGVFGSDIFAAPMQAPGEVPWLGGATLQVGKPERDAQQAWTTALQWLREFRQGTAGPPGQRAREPSSDPRRPSISNWPEADKIRHLKRKTDSHEPNHNAVAAWPRAGFGLPILGQFQTTDRYDNRKGYDEPGPFELRWRSPNRERPNEFDEHDRLASPLIVKALPLAGGKYLPCALWLNRAHPRGAEAGLGRTRGHGPNSVKEVDPASVSPFDRLVAPGDTARFSALDKHPTLREAFLGWLRTTHSTTAVAP